MNDPKPDIVIITQIQRRREEENLAKPLLVGSPQVSAKRQALTVEQAYL
jgi:hypothetical protein